MTSPELVSLLMGPDQMFELRTQIGAEWCGRGDSNFAVADSSTAVVLPIPGWLSAPITVICLRGGLQSRRPALSGCGNRHRARQP